MLGSNSVYPKGDGERRRKVSGEKVINGKDEVSERESMR